MGRFRVRELYEGTFPSGVRQAEVIGVSESGRRGKLRFADTGELVDVAWMELHQAGKWRRIR